METTKEQLKAIDCANTLHAALVLFGHDLISKEAFIEITWKIYGQLGEIAGV